MSWALKSLGRAHGSLVHDRRTRVLAGHFREMIPPSHSVLDVGCGDGLIASLIMTSRPDVRITGVDVLVRPNARIPVIPFDGAHLPFPDASWDTVMFCDVLHHTARPLTLLMEAARVARQAVVIKDHSAEGILAKPTLRLMDFCGNAPHGVSLPYNYLTAQEWDDAFRASGLEPLEVRRQLALYPPLADRIFGRSLHFLGLFRIHRRSL